jgi:hypothetical protein
VTEKVNQIEENIKNLFKVEEAAEEAADEELNEILGEAGEAADAENSIEEGDAVASDKSSEDTPDESERRD